MPRAKAPCGTYSAYKRHLRDGEPVDPACRQASVERSREQVRSRNESAPPAPVIEREAPPVARKGRQESLEWNLRLIESAMVEVDPSRLAPLSKRHSELLAELASMTSEVKEVDPLDEFLSGDLSNVTRFPAAADREAS